ncbi:MAG: hypothetical protein QOJ01_1004, partial [Solirubrobacterales bacterium]|nr:hypothetical protein [Solirubrobacterales bacterium]
MRLVRVAGLDCRPSEIRPVGLHEAAQPQHALKGLRPIPDGCVTAAPKLALAEADVGGQRSHALAWIQKADRRRLNGAVGRAGEGEPGRESPDRAKRLARIDVADQALTRVQAQLRQLDAVVAKLGQ